MCELAFDVELGIVPGSDEAAMALIKKIAKQHVSICLSQHKAYDTSFDILITELFSVTVSAIFEYLFFHEEDIQRSL